MDINEHQDAMTSLAKLSGESLNAASHAALMESESVRNHQDIHNTPIRVIIPSTS